MGHLKAIVISFYTEGTGYEQEAERLRKSLEALDGVEWIIEKVPNRGSWKANTYFKADFMRETLFRLDRPVLWVDADAAVLSYPSLIDEIEADIGVHFRHQSTQSGTVYLEPTEATRLLMDNWVELNREFPDRIMPQENLYRAIRKTPDLRVYKLPREYCCIFDWDSSVQSPVIRHFQASRKFKGNLSGESQ